MKWIISVLLAANVAFFAWHYRERATAPALPPAGEAGEPAYVSRLLLLSELEAPQRSQAAGREPDLPLASDTPPTLGPPGPDAASAAGSQQPSGADQAPPVGGGGEPEVASPAASPLAVAPTAKARDSVSTADAPEAPLPEQPADSATGQTAPGEPEEPVPPDDAPAPPDRVEAAVPEPAPPAPPPVVRCFAVGPLADPAEARPLREWLSQRGFEAALRPGTRQEPRSFWVYLPPAGSEEAARAAVARLQADGVSDLMRVPAGARANSVSLGLYNRASAAEKRLAEIKQLGYEAQLEVRYKEMPATWLDVRVAGDREFPPGGLPSAFPAVEVAEQACP
jgi:hypothetical protein